GARRVPLLRSRQRPPRRAPGWLGLPSLRRELMTQYTYTIFDGNAYRIGTTFEAESVGDALAQVAEFLKDAASEPSHVIHAIIWREDGAVIGSLPHELTVAEKGEAENE